MYRLSFAVFLIIGGGLVFAGIAVKLLLADQALIPMAVHSEISGINHFCRPPSAAQAAASNRQLQHRF